VHEQELIDAGRRPEQVRACARLRRGHLGARLL
jgi:hypothetical protein